MVTKAGLSYGLMQMLVKFLKIFSLPTLCLLCLIDYLGLGFKIFFKLFISYAKSVVFWVSVFRHAVF